MNHIIDLYYFCLENNLNSQKRLRNGLKLQSSNDPLKIITPTQSNEQNNDKTFRETYWSSARYIFIREGQQVIIFKSSTDNANTSSLFRWGDRMVVCISKMRRKETFFLVKRFGNSCMFHYDNKQILVSNNNHPCENSNIKGLQNQVYLIVSFRFIRFDWC